MLRYILAFILASTSAYADCMNPDQWQQSVSQHSSGVSIIVLKDAVDVEARVAMARVNAMPPQTHMIADHIIVLGARSLADNTPSPYFLLAFFNKGCLVSSGRADPVAVAKMFASEGV